MIETVFARHLLELSVQLDIAIRSSVEFSLPSPPQELEEAPGWLRTWAAQVADGREF